MNETIRRFLVKHIKDKKIEDSDDIFALGLVSSLFTMQLVLFVEQEFDFEVSGDDLDIANFRTVNAVAALVERNIQPVNAPPDKEGQHELCVE